MFGEVDKDLPRLMMMAPSLIGVIPHQGSLDRIQRAYDYHSKFDNNAAYEPNYCKAVIAVLVWGLASHGYPC